jgi:hypothetical protein
VDGAQDFLRRQHQQAQDGTPAARQSGIVLVKNSSGSDRSRFDILGVDGTVISPADNPDGFKNQVTLIGVTPRFIPCRQVRHRPRWWRQVIPRRLRRAAARKMVA